MPRVDGTGPTGQGSLTGRRMGACTDDGSQNWDPRAQAWRQTATGRYSHGLLGRLRDRRAMRIGRGRDRR